MVSPGRTLATKNNAIAPSDRTILKRVEELYAFVFEKLIRKVVGQDSTKGGNVKVFEGVANLQSP
jgi:hypothetical protein